MKLPVSLTLIACLIASNATAGPIAQSATRAIMRVDAADLDPSMSRSSIRQSSPAGGTHRRRNILIGLAIGSVAGGVATALHCGGKNASCNEVGPAYVLPLAGAGALIGALWP